VYKSEWPNTFAYGKIFMEDWIDDLERDFDLLFFFKTLEVFPRDREAVGQSPHRKITRH